MLLFLLYFWRLFSFLANVSSCYGYSVKGSISSPRSTELDLPEPIHNLMKNENEPGSFRDEQSVGEIDTLGLQPVELLEERWEVYDNAVSYDPTQCLFARPVEGGEADKCRIPRSNCKSKSVRRHGSSADNKTMRLTARQQMERKRLLDLFISIPS